MNFSEIAIALELMALAVGVALIIWSLRHEGKGIKLGKFFGYIILILSIFMILFTIISATVRSFEMRKMMKGSCPMCKMMEKQDMIQDNSVKNSSEMMQNKSTSTPPT